MTPSRSAHRVLALALGAAGCVVQYSAARDTEATDGDASGSADDTASGGACEADEVACGGTCVDLRWSDEHCGECSAACVDDAACIDGVCRRPCSAGCNEPFGYCAGAVCECADGLTSCGGDCVDLRIDPDHCGGCDEACAPDQACGDGECLPAACPGYDGVCGRSCADLDFDPVHCGSCFDTCWFGSACVFGECLPFNVVPELLCGQCPCFDGCDPDYASCCYYEREDSLICIEGDECP